MNSDATKISFASYSQHKRVSSSLLSHELNTRPNPTALLISFTLSCCCTHHLLFKLNLYPQVQPSTLTKILPLFTPYVSPCLTPKPTRPGPPSAAPTISHQLPHCSQHGFMTPFPSLQAQLITLAPSALLSVWSALLAIHQQPPLQYLCSRQLLHALQTADRRARCA